MKKIGFTFTLLLSLHFAFAQIDGLLTIRTEKGIWLTAHGVDDELEFHWKKLANQIQGSGFIIAHQDQYYVLTSAHVVHNSKALMGLIVAEDRLGKKHRLRLLGLDTYYDLAVLTFKYPSKLDKKIQAFSFAKNQIKQGEEIRCLGSPSTERTFQMKRGIHSGNFNNTDKHLIGFGYWVADVAMEHGMSGGPVLDTGQEVIGINQAKISNQAGLVLDGNIAKKIAYEIIKNKDHRPSRSYTGIRFHEVKDHVKNSTKVKIGKVLENGPAYQKTKDFIGAQIVSINNQPIRSLLDITAIMETIEVGATITMNIQYDNENHKISFPTIRLENHHLENIAHHFFDYHPNYFMQCKDGNYYLHARNCDTHQANSMEINCANIRPLKLVSVGNDSNLMYLLKEEKDIGVIIRLSSKFGGFYIINTQEDNNYKTQFIDHQPMQSFNQRNYFLYY